MERPRSGCADEVTGSLRCELPAVLAAAEIALPAAATRATAALRTFAPLRRSSFVHHQSASHQLSTVASLNGLGGRCVIIDFYEAESSRFTAKAIAKNIHAVYMDTGFIKKRL